MVPVAADTSESGDGGSSQQDVVDTRPQRDGGLDVPDSVTPDAPSADVWTGRSADTTPSDQGQDSAVNTNADAMPDGSADAGTPTDDAAQTDAGLTKQCNEGACCEAATGAFRPAMTPCGKEKPEQWRCVGPKLQARTVHSGCSGQAATCTNDPKFEVTGPWKTQQVCSTGQTCAPKPPKCVPKAPQQLDPCQKGKCWQSKLPLPTLCGSSVKTEDYSSGKYNVHRYLLNTQAKIAIDLSLAPTAGPLKPALVLQTTAGETLFDGTLAVSTSAVQVEVLGTGKTGGPASLRITTAAPMQLHVFVTGWTALDSGFTKGLPQSVKYALTIALDCPAPKPGELKSPPCFDPKNVKNGYVLLPQSCPSGLYTRKADDCSRGSKRLIDTLYTVALRNKQEQPKYAPLHFNDLNEGPCSAVKHQTHKDGTHADIHSGCATKVSCVDNGPAIALAKMFIDTGEACGILFNDTGVQKVVNAYFSSKFTYKPWGSQFMRSVSGHTTHFHLRVKKTNGSCN